MNRRIFLQRATLAACALAVDPERLLWTPGQRTYFEVPRVVPYRVMHGDWIGWSGYRPAEHTGWQRAVFTHANGEWMGVTARLPALGRYDQAAADQVMRQAERDLDRLVKQLGKAM